MKITNNEQIGKQTIQSLVNLTSLNKEVRETQLKELETDKERHRRIKEEISKRLEE